MSDRFTDLDDREWLNLFENVERSWFRLETLQVYAVDYEDEGQTSFAQTGLVDPAPTPWRQMIRRHVDSGRSLRRVHIVEEPLTDYLRYELAVYDLNAEAGEQTGIITVSGGDWPVGLPEATDFWLFDDREVWDMHYDNEGRFVEAVRAESIEQVEQCRRWRDAALSMAVPLDAYALTQH